MVLTLSKQNHQNLRITLVLYVAAHIVRITTELQTDAMRKLSLRILVALITLIISVSSSWLLHRLHQPKPRPIELASCPTPRPAAQSVEKDDARPSDFLEDQDRIQWNGYVIERNTRTTRSPIPQPGNWHKRLNIIFVSIARSRIPLRVFDANIWGLGGNSAEFGFFSFLGPSSKELLITQDTFRGGCQWVVSLSPRFRVIFDGQKFGVGREADYFRSEDLDGDQVKEIIVPLTDFYEFQDKMSISQIPLPDIVFKYNPRLGEYLPANPLFKSQDSRLIDFAGASTDNELEYRSIVLHAMTELIYSGRRAQAWRLFHRDYRLADKLEFERRLKAILKNQTVYRFIYQNRN